MSNIRSGAIALGLALASGFAKADDLISNLLAADTGSTLFGAGSTTVWKAAGFRVPFHSTYLLDAVTLKIDFDEPVPAEAEVSLWRGGGSPSTQLAVLFSGPQTGVGSFTFVAPEPITLEGGETYWIYVRRAPGETGSFRWISTSTAPSGELMNAGYLLNGNPSTFLNKYRVDGVHQSMCINFTTLPGPDGLHGTLDDVLNNAPPTFIQQTDQLGDDFEAHGIVFVGAADNRNEVLSDAFLGGHNGSSPNILASESPQIIEIRFDRPVFGFSAVLGMGEDSTDRISVIGQGGTLLESIEGSNEFVESHSFDEIIALRVTRTANGAYAALDDLCLTFEPPTPCAADLSGSSDPNSADYGVPDGQIDASDFFYYLDQFAAGVLGIADLSGSSDPNSSDYGVPDGQIDASDFFYYLDIFVQGCR